MQNLSQNVYDSLKSATAVIDLKKADCSQLQAKIDSGRYSESAIKGYQEQLADLRREIRRDSDEAIAAARQIVDDFEVAARREMCLKPEDLTDEVKLFNAGVTLNEADLQAMLERVGDNTTMRILIHRYAKDHDIDLPQHGFPEFTAKLDAAKNLRGVLGYYDKWITEDNAQQMLNRFFGAGEV